MTPLFKKLNFKEQKQIYAVNAPVSFDNELKHMLAYAAVKKQIKATDKAEFIIAFCTKQSEIDKLTPVFEKALQGDGVLWFAYPKGSSKKYKCEFNRDTGWGVLGQHGFEGVRMVAIDEDWSALRFRRVEFIKKMIRSFAMTEAGKKKAAVKKK